MRKTKFRLLPMALFLAASTTLWAQDVPQKIRNEGLQHSQVMNNAFYLTDASGPRLNNSPGYLRAANWAQKQLASWGLDARLEPWGDWGKGWELKRSYIAMTSPYYKPIIGFPKAWCEGTGGLKEADIVLVDLKDSSDLDKYKGRLKGKIILFPRTDTLMPSFEADAHRFTDEQLKEMEDWKPEARNAAGGRRRGNFGAMRALIMLQNNLKKMAQEEGAIALLSTNPRGHDGTLFVSGGGSYAADAPPNFLDMVLAYEDYMTLYRLAEHHMPIKLEIDVQTHFKTDDTHGYNVVAEIKGSDSKLKDQLIMVGGHLDSWHSATGATDNAAGCAVMMEAIRILKASGYQPRRTIRICLWGGEEEGLHGSRNYVRNHFTDTATRRFNAEGDKISAYYNLDNGTGRIRGVYLQGNDKVRSLFESWLKPFADLGASTTTLQNTGGTDHLSFDAIGIPGFQFIQDGIEYNTRTHHTNMDSYDHLIAADLMQAATIVASFVYQTDLLNEKLPRKPAPAGQSGRQRF